MSPAGLVACFEDGRECRNLFDAIPRDKPVALDRLDGAAKDTRFQCAA